MQDEMKVKDEDLTTAILKIKGYEEDVTTLGEEGESISLLFVDFSNFTSLRLTLQLALEEHWIHLRGGHETRKIRKLLQKLESAEKDFMAATMGQPMVDWVDASSPSSTSWRRTRSSMASSRAPGT